MDLEIIVDWEPERTFEKAKKLSVLINVAGSEEVKKLYKGTITGSHATEEYISHLLLQSGNRDSCNMIQMKNGELTTFRFAPKNPVIDENGRRGFKITTKEADLEELRYTLARLEVKRYIAPREELVNDQDYCTFYGSSGNLWKASDYPVGDLAERTRQTIYEMEHDQSRVYEWTNVPDQFSLRLNMEADAQFASFAEKEVKPLIDAYWGGPRRDPTLVKTQLLKITEILERYKKEHGIKRLSH